MTIHEEDEKGIFVALVPTIPGCHSQGDSYEEMVTNIKEAIELCLEVAKEDKKYHQKIDWQEISWRYRSSCKIWTFFMSSLSPIKAKKTDKDFIKIGVCPNKTKRESCILCTYRRTNYHRSKSSIETNRNRTPALNSQRYSTFT